SSAIRRESTPVMKNILALLIIAIVLIAPIASASEAGAAQELAARGVLQRLLVGRAEDFVLRTIAKQEDSDVYEFEARDGRVTVAGSSGVTICRGAYDYLKQHADAIVTWEGSHFDLPARLPDAPRTRVVCPNRYRDYFNVCTFGYTSA